MLLALLGCVLPDDATKLDDSGADDSAADDSAGRDSAAPCEAIEGAPAFTLEHGSLDGEVAVPWYDPVDEEAGVVVLGGDGCARQVYTGGLFPSAARWSGGDLWFNQMGMGHALYRVAPDGTVETLELAGAHHDFVVGADGTLAWLVEEVRNMDGVAYLGDLVRERAPDGTERDVWSAFEHLPLTTYERCEGKDPVDWTHANGMAPTADGYLVSLYCSAQVVEIDRVTGQILRTLDGDAAAVPFGPQHAPSLSPDGVRMFDNSGPEGSSRLLEVGWDGAIRWAWSSEERLQTPVLGDVYAREDGVILGAFGAEGVVLAVDAAGEEIWRVAAPGLVVGRVDWRP